MTAQEYVNGLFELTGHVGIITGASRGIGLGEAEAFCKSRKWGLKLPINPQQR